MKSILAILSAAILLTGCQSLTPSQEAALRGAAKLALSFGLAELSDRVKEIRPYRDKLNTLFETTFSKAVAPEALGEQLKAGVAKVVPAELQAVVLAQLKAALRDKTVAGPAGGNAGFNARIALKL